jgi:integrase
MITTGKKLTIAKAITAWVAWMTARSFSPKTISNYVSTVSRWMRDEELENQPPSSITPDRISKWINRKSASKASTRAISLAELRSFFSFCSAKGWTVGDPAFITSVSLDHLSHEQKEATVRQPFTQAEVRRIVRELEQRKDIFWLFATKCSAEVGLRLGDICRLEWDCFNTAGQLIIHTDKSNKRLALPISKELAELVTKIPVEDDTCVFPEQRRIIMDMNRRTVLSMQFKRLCESLGIEGKSFHCLRLTVKANKFASQDKAALARKLADVLSLEEIGKLLGHSNTATTNNSTH